MLCDAGTMIGPCKALMHGWAAVLPLLGDFCMPFSCYEKRTLILSRGRLLQRSRINLVDF